MKVTQCITEEAQNLTVTELCVTNKRCKKNQQS